MRNALGTLALIIGSIIGAMVPLGETPASAQTLPNCIQGEYMIVTKGAQALMGVDGKTILFQVTSGTFTVNNVHNWAYGFKVYAGNVSNGIMTVNAEYTVPDHSVGQVLNPSLGRTYFLVELQCEHQVTAIKSKTVNTSGNTTGITINWIPGCSVLAATKIGSTALPSVLLNYNTNRVAGLMVVTSEAYVGAVTVTVPGNATTLSVPYTIYTGQWQTQYYFGESSDKIQGSVILGFNDFLGIAPWLEPYPWIQMGYTVFNQASMVYGFGKEPTPQTMYMTFGDTSNPEALPHNGFVAAFRCE